MRICAAQLMNLSSAGVLGQNSTFTVSVLSLGIVNGTVPFGEYVEDHVQNCGVAFGIPPASIKSESIVMGCTMDLFTRGNLRSMQSHGFVYPQFIRVIGTSKGMMIPLPVKVPCSVIGQGESEYAFMIPV